MSDGSGDGGEDARRMRNMQDLLRFCLQGTAAEDAPNPVQPIDPERLAWLENALKSLSVNVVQEMLEAVANIKRQLRQLELLNLNTCSGDLNRDEESPVESIVNSVDTLLDRTEDLDMASDFEKIGGFTILCPLLLSPQSEIKVKGCELVGALVQNHEYCQNAAIDHGVLDVLIKLIDWDDGGVDVKALYAMSCLLRANEKAHDDFVNNRNGFSVLLRAMQNSEPGVGPKMRTKSAFLLGSIIRGRSDFKDTLMSMGFIEQMIGLLHQERDESHEHLLSTLLTFLTDFPPALEESLRPELLFVQLLQQRIEDTKGKPEYLEEGEYCQQLLSLLNTAGADGAENEVSDR